MSRRSSDLDFRDVFGGPPRRSGVYDRQSGRADSFDSSAYPGGRSRGGEDRLQFRKSPSSSGLVEKPVFGELNSPARRRHLANNFFDDIFPGSDQSGNSTPKRADQDVFSPTPGPRVLSPNRPVPVGGSSLFPRHSLPVKVVKGVEYPFHSARIQPSTFKIEESGAHDASEFLYMPDSSPCADEIVEEQRSAGKLLNNFSPLVRQLSQDMNEASSIETQTQKDRISLENYINSKRFHFSIYKWAGKGVSLNLPSNSKEGADPVSRIRRLTEVVIQSVDVPYDDDKVVAATGTPNNDNENKDKTSPNDIPMESKDVANSIRTEDILPCETGSKHSSQDLIENSGEGMMNISNEDVPVSLPDPGKSESRNLSQLFSYDSGEKGIEETTRQVTSAESSTDGQKDQPNIKDEYKAKKQAQEENKEVQVEAAAIHDIQYFPATSGDKVPGKKAKGKVKDFIKIFSQEGSPKRKATSDTEDWKSKGKERTKHKVDEQNISVAEEDEEVKSCHTKIEQPSMVTPVELNKTSREDWIHHSPTMSDVHTTDGGPSTSIDSNLVASSEPVNESINISVEESPYEDFEGCLVEEVTQDQNEPSHAESEQDQIKAADVKIPEWSKGKEGNIRSLLSTLQYVLWPESGWKPVPLVNIIEGSSVKRSYQRALLCLHPDKLQQRGAAAHQKYIAEKVFDILQEAWDQFNSLSVF